MGFPLGPSSKEPICLCRRHKRQVQFLGWGDPLQEGMAMHSSVSCLENLMDRGAWWATVHSVVPSQTPLK